MENEKDICIVGIDNMNDYYDVSLKEYRLKKIEEAVQKTVSNKWTFIKGNIADKSLIEDCFKTYSFDIVVDLAAQEGVQRVMKKPPQKAKGEDGLPIPPYAVYNIGNSSPENLLDFVDILQQELISAGVLPEDYDFEAHKKFVPMQAGDVPITYADTSALERDFNFKPSTSLRQGLRNFAKWYKEFYNI